MNVCYIVGAGDFYGEIHRDDSDLVIAADGGYDTLISHGVICDLLIGDLDSIKSAPDETETLRFPVEKDDTDTFLAFKEGYERGYRIFHVYGGTGGRPDHTYANYQLLLHAKRVGADAYLFDNNTVSFVLKNESRVLSGKSGQTFSVFALGSEARGVTIDGAKYEAQSVTLSSDFPLGVSNSFLDSPVTVTVQDGELMIMM